MPSGTLPPILFGSPSPPRELSPPRKRRKTNTGGRGVRSLSEDRADLSRRSPSNRNSAGAQIQLGTASRERSASTSSSSSTGSLEATYQEAHQLAESKGDTQMLGVLDRLRSKFHNRIDKKSTKIGDLKEEIQEADTIVTDLAAQKWELASKNQTLDTDLADTRKRNALLEKNHITQNTIVPQLRDFALLKQQNKAYARRAALAESSNPGFPMLRRPTIREERILPDPTPSSPQRELQHEQDRAMIERLSSTSPAPESPRPSNLPRPNTW
jgi:hypothetical protein